MLKRAALVLVCAIAIAACGSSSNTDTSNTAKSPPQALAFSECMRAHGVPNFPDPQTSGGGFRFHIGPGSDINPQSPAFRSAQTSCKHLLPGGGPPSGPASPQAMAHLLQVSECLRAHGVVGFPDPTTKPPPDSPGNGAVLDMNGAVLDIPSSINPQSPAFQKAAKVCGFGP
jgi:hypothetical protein